MRGVGKPLDRGLWGSRWRALARASRGPRQCIGRHLSMLCRSLPVNMTPRSRMTNGSSGSSCFTQRDTAVLDAASQVCSRFLKEQELRYRQCCVENVWSRTQDDASNLETSVLISWQLESAVRDERQWSFPVFDVESRFVEMLLR